MKLKTSLYTFLFAGIIGCAGLEALGQSASADSIRVTFDRYRKNALQEKLYLQTDRPNYLTGETLWFKVMVIDGSFHRPVTTSKVAYIEILDRFNQPVLQTKVSLRDGQGAGSVFLTASLSSGNYQVRAYTNWMKNFDEAFFFSKTITILNTFRKIESEATASSTPALDAQFFPEGGNLISGITGKVAFRVVNQNGTGINFKGYLLNEHQDTVARFAPHKFGIGHFTFTPSAGHTYRAVIREASGKITAVKFPVVADKGYALRVVDTTASEISISVSANLGEAQTSFAVFIHARNIIARFETGSLHDNQATLHISKRDLPDGISHVTLFDQNMNAACERLYFKKPENMLAVSAETDQQRYANRRRVTLDLQTMLADQPKAAALAVSVYKMDSLPEFQQSITDYLWLTSDLKGSVESPSYYFSADTPEVKEAQDNLMLTHGWRRFVWSDITKKQVTHFTYLPEYRNHIIQGVVRSTDGKPAFGILTYLASPGKTIRLYSSRSNAEGEVFYEMQHFEGNTRIIVQTNPATDSTYRIDILSPFPVQKGQPVIPPVMLTPASASSLSDRSMAMQVQDVYFGAQQDAHVQPSVLADTTAFFGKPDEVYFLDAFTRFPVMEEVMREYVPGVMVRKRKDGFHFLVLDNVNRKVFDETPLILLDGVPLFDADEIMSFDPLKIKKLEVMTRQYYLGPLWLRGIVSYTTYAGDLSGFTLQPRSLRMNYEGLQLQREFFSPRYESPKQRESRMPDQRTLLYWNPYVSTDATGKQRIDFFTSDVPGQYRVVVEGITPDGRAGSASHTFFVSEVNH